MSNVQKLRIAALLASTSLLASCAVGPDFEKPKAPDAAGYTPAPPTVTSQTPNVVGGDAQRFVSGQDISGEWWTLFHSAPLNALIERALKNNPDLKSAQAALRVAREAVFAQQGAYYPQVSAGFSATRQKSSESIAPVPNANVFYFNLFTPQVDVSYTPDVFGLNRRTVESLKAQAEQTRFALIATQITLTSNIVAAAVQEASLRAQIKATRDLIDLNTKMLAILRNQLAKGLANRLDVAAQESQLAQAVATLPPLLKQLAQQRDLLADLSGAYPDKALPEEFTLDDLHLPGDLPLSLPSRLVEQRPDIRQAEENLHAASAQIGVAVANRLPTITLSASAGTQALTAGGIFDSSNSFWTLAAGITQPVFDGGTLLHREHAARDAYVEASEQYRSTVLAAFQNVADTLNALLQDADAVKSESDAASAAKVTFELSRKQFQAGYINNLTAWTAEIAYQQSQISLVQAQASRYADTAALFQALGGGWWNRTDAAPAESYTSAKE